MFTETTSEAGHQKRAEKQKSEQTKCITSLLSTCTRAQRTKKWIRLLLGRHRGQTPSVPHMRSSSARECCYCCCCCKRVPLLYLRKRAVRDRTAPPCPPLIQQYDPKLRESTFPPPFRPTHSRRWKPRPSLQMVRGDSNNNNQYFTAMTKQRGVRFLSGFGSSVPPLHVQELT